MNNAEGNPTQEQQQNIVAGSTMKKPAEDTAQAAGSDVNRAASQSAGHPSSNAAGAEGSAEPNRAPRNKGRGTAPVLERAHPRGMDAINDETLDDTVDTDGKNHDAAKHWINTDNQVGNDSTLANSAPTSAEGLAGFDSRPYGNVPPIATDGDYVVINAGTVEEVGATVAGGEEFITTPQGQPSHVPLNHGRVAHVLKVIPKKER